MNTFVYLRVDSVDRQKQVDRDGHDVQQRSRTELKWTVDLAVALTGRPSRAPQNGEVINQSVAEFEQKLLTQANNRKKTMLAQRHRGENEQLQDGVWK